MAPTRCFSYSSHRDQNQPPEKRIYAVSSYQKNKISSQNTEGSPEFEIHRRVPTLDIFDDVRYFF